MVVRLRGWAADRGFQVNATVVSRTEDELILQTEDGHIAVVRPRYVGSILGSPDISASDVPDRTICNFSWDGDHIAYATFDEDEYGDITIVPHDGTYSLTYQDIKRRP